jgi:RING-H2 zinc finger domain
MSFSQTSYQNIYGFHILDELHNFFPELLYDEQMFPNDMFAYVRFRCRSLFPEYVRQQNIYNIFQANSRRLEFQAWRNTNLQQEPEPITPVRPIRQAMPAAPRRVVRQNPAQTRTTLFQFPLESANLMDLLLTAANQPGILFPLGSDVPVVPTNEQIDTNTHVLLPNAVGTNAICSICQEHGNETAAWRALNVCSHQFHDRCIRRWFQEHVTCPMCRADIREPHTA